jgi:phosphomannomutase
MSKTGHKFDSTILREYDIRGVVGKTLHDRRCRRDRPRLRHDGRRNGGRSVALGFDGRLSSPDWPGLRPRG